MTKYTQEQLEKMSDFEINLAVAEADIGRDNFVVQDGLIIKHLSSDAECKMIILTKVINYCSNPSDIMPLAFGADISLIKDKGAHFYCAVSGYDDRNNDFARSDSGHVHNKNPLRAIAIVYLLIKQGE